jgi:FKBP-type peptidyl-prolyl cis-trans isomerase
MPRPRFAAAARRALLPPLLLIATHGLAAASGAAPKDDAASYSLGLSFATQWRESGLEGVISEDALIRGIHAGLAGTPLTAADRERASGLLHDAYEAWAARNKAVAAAFLAKNAKQPDIKTTASGLQYTVITKGGPGPTAGANDRVTVQYRESLQNGAEMDSSYARGKPAVIRPNATLNGWREALGMMSKGAHWRVFVPPDLGYGTTPPPSIPPNSLLIFDIELLDIEPAGDAHPAAAIAKPQ